MPFRVSHKGDPMEVDNKDAESYTVLWSRHCNGTEGYAFTPLCSILTRVSFVKEFMHRGEAGQEMLRAIAFMAMDSTQ